MSDLNIENVSPTSNQDYNFGLEGVYLMYSAESLHQKRLQDLESKQQELNDKLMSLKEHLHKSYNHLKTDNNQSLDLTHAKENILKMWHEWKEGLKQRRPDEYNKFKTDLEELDFSKLSFEHLNDTLIPQLEKLQKDYEFQYQKIPNELRMFIELFTILVEILKEFPKKYSELNGHINRSSSRG